ncbi:MAG: putative signal transducing protein [Desulfomonilaceae bacterium]
MNLDEAVVLRTFANDFEANIAASSLSAQGIETDIQKDDVGGAYPALQMSTGVRLLVKPEDREAAEKILGEIEAEHAGKIEQEEEQEDSKSTKPDPIRILRRSFLFLIGFAAGYFLPALWGRSWRTVVLKDDWKDGKPGSISHYVDGKLKLVEEDRNYDGKIDAWHKYVSGKIRTSEFDDNFHGQPNRWVEYKDRFTYVEKWDTDFDGKPDATTFFVNELMQRVDWHPKDSEIIEQRELYEHGVLKEKLVDTDRDGIFDLRITYDPYWKPIKEAKCWIRS